MKHNFKVFGKEPIGIVVEMGLGSCLSEWIPMAKLLQGECGVLLYERAGINKSYPSDNERTPYNIANELFELLKQIHHMEKIIIVSHSQGGLYAQQFCRLFPYLVKGVIFIDPLSPRDIEFKKVLTEKEYQKSGVDKSSNFKIMRLLAKLKLGCISKYFMKNAPPFYYYKNFSKNETEDILNSVTKVPHASTAIEEYTKAHDMENIKALLGKDNFPNIPLVLVTHSSELAVEESMQFGSNSKSFAEKVEVMWQELMKDYLNYSEKSIWIQAKKSTHYIHLQEPELIVRLIKEELNLPLHSIELCYNEDRNRSNRPQSG